MSWFKLDDKGAFHRKVLAAGNEAYGAWCRAGQWCSEHLTDGVLSREAAALIANEANWKHLLHVGLCERAGDDIVLHDYLDYNPSRREVMATKKARAAAGKVGGLRSGRSRSKPSDVASTSGQADAKHDKGDGTGRDLGIFSESESESGSHQASGRKARAPVPKVLLPADWTLSDIDRAFATKREWPDQKTNFESERFRAHHEREQTLSGSWAASWRTWVLNDAKFTPTNGRSASSPAASKSERQLAIAKKLMDEAKEAS